MLFVLCCTAARTVGFLKRRIETRTALTITLADNEAGAMELLRQLAAAEFGERIGEWNLELHVTEIPAALCVLASLQAMMDRQACEANSVNGTPPDSGTEASDGNEEQVREDEDGHDPEPEAQGGVRSEGVGGAA